jgi:hypothetical protein
MSNTNPSPKVQSLPELIADLVRAGVAPDLIGRVAALPVVPDLSRTLREIVPDIIKEYAAERKRAQREISTKSGSKQTMAALVEVGRLVPDKADENLSLPTNPSLLPSFDSSKKESKKDSTRTKPNTPTEQASLRKGSRLSSGEAPHPGAIEFAVAQGFDPVTAEQIWVEFVDYWVGIPGKPGVKLSWLGVWRNRIRFLIKKHGKPAQPAQNSATSTNGSTVAADRTFVEVDSPKWQAWKTHRGRSWPEKDFQINGHYKRGWWFETEWPPQQQ